DRYRAVVADVDAAAVGEHLDPAGEQAREAGAVVADDALSDRERPAVLNVNAAAGREAAVRYCNDRLVAGNGGVLERQRPDSGAPDSAAVGVAGYRSTGHVVAEGRSDQREPSVVADSAAVAAGEGATAAGARRPDGRGSRRRRPIADNDAVADRDGRAGPSVGGPR